MAVRYPKNWKEMSLDMRLMFLYHGSMMAMMIGGGSLTVKQELAIAAAIAAVIFMVSRRHRQKKHWRWPGVRPLDVVYAMGGIVFILFFLYSATPLFPPNNGHVVPWYLAGVGIGIFGVLQSLKLAYNSETEFSSNCVVIDQYGREIEPPREPPPVEPTELRWKRVARVLYAGVFVIVWLCGVASFYLFGTAFKKGSAEPTVTQTEQLEDHSKIVYVTPTEKERVHIFQMVSWIGVPIILASGAILHFLLGVKLFPNTPTLSEYLLRRRNKSLSAG